MNTAHTIIGSKTRFKGKVNIDKDFRIDGTFEGIVNSFADIVVSEGAVFDGSMTCRNLTVFGKASGHVTCEGLFKLVNGGTYTGEVFAEELDLVPGCDFNGSIVRS